VSPTERFDQLGTSVNAELGDGPDNERRQRQRRGLLAATSAKTPFAPSRWRWALALIVAPAVAVVAVLASTSTAPDPDVLSQMLAAAAPASGAQVRELECRDASGVRIADRSYVAAEQDEQQLHFSDGSRLRLREAARLLVNRVRPTGVRLRLESGELQAHVKSGRGIVWDTLAGPYLVRVTEGQLQMRWEPEPQRLTVTMVRGQASVQGATILGGRLRVRAPETVVVTVRGDEVKRSASPPPRPQTLDGPRPVRADASQPTMPSGSRPTPVVAAPRARPTPPRKNRRPNRPRVTPEPKPLPAKAPTPPSAEPAAKTPPPPPKPLSWRELAADGDYRGAYAALAPALERLSATATSRDLIAVADVARLAGRPKVATGVLKALRKRYSSGADRARATFRLGRIAMDQLNDHARAVVWFQTYLREYPRGSRVGPARGRLMQALVRLGRRAAAKRVAESYLQRSPSGAYCPVAQKILGGDSAACGKP